MVGKKVELFFWKDREGDQVFSAFMPTLIGGGLWTPDNETFFPVDAAKDPHAQSVRDALTMPDPVPDNTVVRLTLTVEAVEAAPVALDFKPYRPGRRP